MKTSGLKMALMALVAVVGVSCCGGNNGCKKTCNDQCDSVCQGKCEQDCKQACAKTCPAQAAAACANRVYNPNEPINLTDMNIFFESDKAEVTQLKPNVTRKMAHLNDLMITIVTIEGVMAEPDPVHAHVAEQTCYIAEGDVTVTIGDRSQRLKTGDIFLVPANVPHTVQSHKDKLVLIDNFNPIREDFLKK